MGERKVLNKYYPPDFDPAKIPRRRQPKNQQMKVRMMLPMSIRCNTCGNYVYKGTKFNSRKEDVIGEKYLGIQIFRFYFKCTKCSAELTIKTDPQNSDYVVESGATRNFEPWRAEDEESENQKRKRASEEMGDAMKSLENRTLDSKMEMDILAALDEMKSMKSRHATVSTDSLLEALQHTASQKEKRLEEEDEAVIKSIVFHNSENFVRRISDDEEDDDDSEENVIEQFGESSKNEFKKQKTAGKFSATNNLPTHNNSQNPNIEEAETVKPKPVRNSPFVMFKVLKKDSAAPLKTGTANGKVDTLVEEEGEKKKEDAPKDSGLTTPLVQSLCQYSDSDDDSS